MFKKFADYRAKRKELAKKREHLRGYDFAAGVLLRSKGTINPRDCIDTVFSEKTHFDYGIEAACRDYDTHRCHLVPKVPHISERESQCLIVMQEFCRRVENGQIRSSRTYDQFKHILGTK